MPLSRRNAPDGLRPVVEREFERSVAGLVEQIADGDAVQRRRAARDLGGRPEAVDALAARLRVEKSEPVREALFTALAATPCARSAAVLLPLLRSDDAGLRGGAIDALATMPDALGDGIDALLADADADTRIMALNLAASLAHPRVHRWLLQGLSDPVANVVGTAIDALAEAGRPDDAPALRAAARRFPDDPFVSFAVSVALERIGSD